MTQVVGVVSVRGRAAELPAWPVLARSLFDAVIAVDEGLDEPARDRLRADRLVARILSAGERGRALDEAVALGARWVVILGGDERFDRDDATALRAFLASDALPGCAYGLQRFATWNERTYDPGFTCAYRVFAPKAGQSLTAEDPHPIPREIPRAARLRTTVRMRAVGAAVGAQPPDAPVWRSRSPAQPVLGSPAGTRDDVREYDGALTWRCGEPMRPDVGEAFDALAAAAENEAGLALWVNSAFRADDEQARMFPAVCEATLGAPAGASLHRYGTELDLGPPAAYAWLQRHAGRFGFARRYAWEPWHYGYGPVPYDAFGCAVDDGPQPLQEPLIVPRARWGADESLRVDRDGNERWPEAHAPVCGIVLHHTVTPNGERDVAHRLRGIYRFHAVERGWGDIGYHLVVDEAGRVYEGRHGTLAAQRRGEGVVGAHTRGFNRGSIGIALLGTLTERDATPQARASLENLLAWLAAMHGIDPAANVNWPRIGPLRDTAPTICGHRDLAEVVCPGDAFYATLPELRASVASRLGPRPAQPVAAASAA
jgi:hypothetical protein